MGTLADRWPEGTAFVGSSVEIGKPIVLVTIK